MLGIAGSLLVGALLAAAAGGRAGKAEPAAGHGALGTDEILARARELYDALEYPAVVELLRKVSSRDDLTLEQKKLAYLLQGSALAVIADPIDAQMPLRSLLRAYPSFEMPAGTPPKIMAVFRLVQAEERALAAQLQEVLRHNIANDTAIVGDLPSDAKGGWPLELAYFVRDPHKVVDAVNLHYRRAAGEPFSVLALARDPTGAWSGRLSGELTESEAGLELECFVSALDARAGPVKTFGGPDAPLRLAIAPGLVSDAVPLYRKAWFWGAVVSAAALLGVGAWLWIDNATELPSTGYRVDL